MSENNRDLPDDLEASTPSDPSDSQKDSSTAPTSDTSAVSSSDANTASADAAASSGSTATSNDQTGTFSESDFEQNLDELNSAMVSGALANKLRGRLQRHTEEMREELANDREAREYVEASKSSGGSATPSENESSRDASSRDSSKADASRDQISQNTRDFLASLDERFPGVSRRSEDEDVEAPPPPPAAESAEGGAGGAGKAGAALAGGAAAAGAASVAKQVADKSRDYASRSKAFMSQTAERIAKKAAELQEQRREKREAKRQAEEEAQRAAELEAKSAEQDRADAQGDGASGADTDAKGSAGSKKSADDPTSFDSIVYSGFAGEDDSATSAGSARSGKSAGSARRAKSAKPGDATGSATDSAGEHETGVYPYPPAPKGDDEVEWHSFDGERAGAEVRHSGDTDHLEPVDSEEPKQVKFTRKGAPILKLPSGTRVVKNSMQSVRSTVDALNAGERIDPTRPTIALFAVLVLVAAVLASTTLLGTGKLSPRTSAFFNDTEQTQQTQQEEATEAPEEVQQAPAAGPAPEIASIEVISYNDDGGDHQEWADLMIDGDVGTRWQSRYFAQPDLPEGNTIRLIIKLKQETTVSGVTFNGPLDGGQVDLRINDGSDPFGTPVITSSQMSATTTLQATEPVVGNTVTLNFVALPTEDEGRYRVKIDELSVQ